METNQLLVVPAKAMTVPFGSAQTSDSAIMLALQRRGLCIAFRNADPSLAKHLTPHQRTYLLGAIVDLDRRIHGQLGILGLDPVRELPRCEPTMASPPVSRTWRSTTFRSRLARPGRERDSNRCVRHPFAVVTASLRTRATSRSGLQGCTVCTHLLLWSLAASSAGDRAVRGHRCAPTQIDGPNLRT